MSILKLLILGIVIASNNLAASLALGALGQIGRLWRIVFIFGIFEFLIPLIGIWLGRTVAKMIATEINVLSILLLSGMAIWMIISGIRHRKKDEKIARQVTSWTGLTLLAAGLSADNLIIGFSLGLEGMNALIIAGIISVCSMLFTWIGIHLGASSRRHWEQYAEIGAGVLLLLLVVAKILNWI